MKNVWKRWNTVSDLQNEVWVKKSFYSPACSGCSREINIRFYTPECSSEIKYQILHPWLQQGNKVSLLSQSLTNKVPGLACTECLSRLLGVGRGGVDPPFKVQLQGILNLGIDR